MAQQSALGARYATGSGAAMTVAALAAITVLLLLGKQGQAAPRQNGELTRVRYAAGWNLVAASTATELTAASGPQYAFGPDGTGYVTVHPGEIVGGRAVWAYFPSATEQELGRTAATYTRVIAPPEQWVLLGNPSTSQPSELRGADQALAYDAANGYTQVSSLAPGQGAWVLSHAGGEIVAGSLPSDSLSQQLNAIQAELTSNPTDRANVDMLSTVAGELVRMHQLDRVQATMDDLRSSFEDGLRLKSAAPLPEMTSLQSRSARTVREKVAAARDAAQQGDFVSADRAVADAAAAALQAENDAVSQAAGSRSAAVYARAGQAGQTPQSLSLFGGIVRTAFFGSSLGTPPTEQFWSAATSVLGGLAVPQSAAAAAATATPAGACDPSCAFDGTGNGHLTLNSAGFMISITLTFHIVVSGGRVTGSGQENITYQLAAGGPCSFTPTMDSLTVGGTLTGTTLHLNFSGGGGTTTLTCNAAGGSLSEPFALGAGQGFDPISIEAKDGATATSNVIASLSSAYSGSLTVTLHASR